MDDGPVVDRVAALARSSEFVLVGIGGRGGAGKTSLARAIPGAEIISTDEFWNGREFELARLRRDVFDPFVAGGPARFESFDWAAQKAHGVRVVEPRGIVVVEGVCALHRLFRDDYALRVWVEAPRELRLARGIARDGEAARATWEEIWMPMEDRYVERDDPVAAADLIVDGTV
jgi:uridine kinase